jgi:ZIP family zinc transporter
MVLVKGFAQLEPVFPAMGYAHDDTQFFKQLGRAVHTGAVDPRASRNKFGHGKTGVVLQCVKHSLPRLSKTKAVVLQNLFEDSLGAHAAILPKIATFLQKLRTAEYARVVLLNNKLTGLLVRSALCIRSINMVIILGVCAFLASLAGGYVALKNQDKLQRLLGLTAGIVMGVVVFGLLPEIMELAESTTRDITTAMIALMAGFLVFHIVEKSILISHASETQYGEHHHPHVGRAGALALAGHSLLDGFGIGLAFQTNAVVGVAVAVAVVAHSFSDGLNTVNLMLAHKNEQSKARRMLFVDALAPLVGVLLSLVVTLGNEFVLFYLSFFAGFLLYIGAAEILPEAHSKRSSYVTIALTVLGAALMYFVTRLA